MMRATSGFARMSRAIAWGLRAALLLSLCGSAAWADSAHHTLWHVQGRSNVVYLLGSIHVLRERDYPLPAAVMDAYSKAQVLVLEINLDDMESPEIQAEMMAAAAGPDGKTLHDVLGAARYARAAELAKEVGFDLDNFDQFAPWFAAETISQLQLMELGFSPTSGIDVYLASQARADRKDLGALETAHEQIALFESLDAQRQADYLVASLEESKNLPREVDRMVSAWRTGDAAWFGNQLERELGSDPRLYSAMLSSRNRRWVPKIEGFLNERKNYLVVVGAGHLAGPDSVIQLLRKDGYTVVQD